MVVNARSSRTPKARALGAALSEARDAAGHGLRAFAKIIDKDPSLLSRWESGERIPKETDVARILAALGINGQRYEEILELARDTDAPRWIAVSLPEQRQHMNALLRFERDASSITDVTPLLPTGLLQTADCIRAIMVSGGVPEDEIESRIRLRLGRQQVLESVSLTAVLGEPVLHQELGGRSVLLGQLRHLLVMADHPNVDLRVIPYTVGWHPALEGGWTVIESHVAPTVIHLENRKSGQFLHEDDDVAVYRDSSASAIEVAMSPAASAELIADKIKQLEMR